MIAHNNEWVVQKDLVNYQSNPKRSWQTTEGKLLLHYYCRKVIPRVSSEAKSANNSNKMSKNKMLVLLGCLTAFLAVRDYLTSPMSNVQSLSGVGPSSTTTTTPNAPRTLGKVEASWPSETTNVDPAALVARLLKMESSIQLLQSTTSSAKTAPMDTVQEARIARLEAHLNQNQAAATAAVALPSSSIHPDVEARLAKMEAELENLRKPLAATTPNYEDRIAKMESQLAQAAIMMNNNNNNNQVVKSDGNSLATLTATASTTTPVLQQQQQQAASFPPVCNDELFAGASKVRPMRDTNCPDATWLEDKNPTNLRSSSSSKNILFEPSHGRAPLAMFVGCNKGIDAVNVLRFLSQNPAYDKSAWIVALDIENPRGVCSADTNGQAEVYADQQRPATLHCIEAMPSTYEKLRDAALKLGWDKDFVIHHGAASDQDGTIQFPNVAPGYEAKGMEDCQLDKHKCVDVKMYTLDSFVREKFDASQQQSIIDYLSIDVEGFDIAVMRGGKTTLSRVKYLEFEVHNKGVWKNVALATAITELQEQNFVCYYAGREGKLWRLTNCMRGPGASIFSNVACANVNLAPNLAKHMEDVFLQTVAAQAS